MTSYDAFAPLYDAWSSHMTEDVEFYVGLAREADGPLVELARLNRTGCPAAVSRPGRSCDRPKLGEW